MTEPISPIQIAIGIAVLIGVVYAIYRMWREIDRQHFVTKYYRDREGR